MEAIKEPPHSNEMKPSSRERYSGSATSTSGMSLMSLRRSDSRPSLDHYLFQATGTGR